MDRVIVGIALCVIVTAKLGTAERVGDGVWVGTWVAELVGVVVQLSEHVCTT